VGAGVWRTIVVPVIDTLGMGLATTRDYSDSRQFAFAESAGTAVWLL